MFRSIKTNQLQERELAFHLDGTGSASLVIGSGLATLAVTGTGDYLLTFSKPFARKPIVTVQNLTAAKTARPGTVAVGSVQILGFNQADGTTAADIDAYITVKGWDYPHEFKA